MLAGSQGEWLSCFTRCNAALGWFAMPHTLPPPSPTPTSPDELTALRQQPGIGQQLHELQQLKTVGMGSTRAKVLEQRANKDAAKARQDAARRAQVVSSCCAAAVSGGSRAWWEQEVAGCCV